MWDYVKRSNSWPKVWRSFLALQSAISSYDPKQLVRDPYALPVARAKDADYGVRGLISGALQYEAENLYVINLMRSVLTEHQEDKLISSLESIVPCSPKLMADLFGKSNVAIAEKLITLFQSSSSVLALVHNHVKFSSIVQHAERSDKLMLEELARHAPERNSGPVLCHRQNIALPEPPPQ